MLAIKELLPARRVKPAPPMLPWTLAAGVIHGIFATGGPLLVYAMNAQKMDKATFRSTLALVWLSMAILLISSLLVAGKLTVSDSDNIGLLLLVLLASITLGEWLHHQVNAELFTRIINSLLLIGGLLLLRS